MPSEPPAPVDDPASELPPAGEGAAPPSGALDTPAAADPVTASAAHERRGDDHRHGLDHRASRQSQWVALFFGFVASLALSAVFLGDVLGSVADEIRMITIAVAIAVLALGVIFVVTYALRDRLLRRLALPVPGTLSDVVLKLRRGLEAWRTDDRQSTAERIYEGISSLAVWMAWARVRAWMLGTLIGAASIFALLVGEVLILRQNMLIEDQNTYLRAQNQNIQDQLRLEREQSYQARRARLIATLYDRASCPRGLCPHKASLRARADAARAFGEIELARLAEATAAPIDAVCDLTGASPSTVARAEQQRLDLRHLDLGPVSLDHGAPTGGDTRAMRAGLEGWTACGARLNHAVLRDAELARARLPRAVLVEAELTGADLGEADLTHADLRRAQMAEVVLRGAQLVGARLTGAQLRGAELSPAGTADRPRPTDLTGASLESAAMSGADLRRARLVRADLRRVDLTDADLSGADLTGARLTGATLLRTKMTGALCPDGRPETGDRCAGRGR